MRVWIDIQLRSASLAVVLVAVGCGMDTGSGIRTPPRMWIVGATGAGATIFSSDDRGRRWTRTTGVPAARLSAVAFVGRAHGWVVGSAIFHTRDGGSSWSLQSNGVPVSPPIHLRDVAFADPSRGVTVGFIGPLPAPDFFPASFTLHTNDAGQFWQDAPSALVVAGGVSLSATCLTPDGVALAVGGAGFNSVTSRSLALVSGDGGETWAPIDSTLVLLPDGALRDVACVSTDHLWIVGRRKCEPFCGDRREPLLIVRSPDGGKTWEDQSLRPRIGSPDSGLHAITFIDPAHGWVVGFEGEEHDLPLALVLTTNDRGAHWHRQDLPAMPPGVLDAVFASDLDGFIAGRSLEGTPMAFSTADGGREWAPVALPADLERIADVALVP